MISAPGIFSISAQEYHKDPVERPSLSSSISKILIEQSPAHAWLAHPRMNLKTFERDANSRADLGSAAHAMLLEPANDPVVVVVDAKNWRTNAAKEAREAALAQGKFPVLKEKYEDIQDMVTTAQDFIYNTELQGIFEHGLTEQTVVWQEESGIWCRCRPDKMTRDYKIILDYKTTSSAAPDEVAKQIGRMQYDLQSEFYERGVFQATGVEPTFVFLFQEITAPYACSLISLSAAYKEVGALKVKRAMKLWETGVTTGNWLGYSNRVLYVEPKPWTVMEAEQLGAED